MLSYFSVFLVFKSTCKAVIFLWVPLWSQSIGVYNCLWYNSKLSVISASLFSFTEELQSTMGFPVGSVGKESACNGGDSGFILGLWRSLGEGNGNPLQYSCLENPMDRGVWRATVHGVAHELDTTEHISGSRENTGWGCRLGSEQRQS